MAEENMALPPGPDDIPLPMENMDNMAEAGGFGENFKMPSREELLAMLDSMGLDDKEKEDLRAALMEEPPGMAAGSIFTSQGFVLLTFLLLVASVFAFFGYKLYKSLKDKEVKREEKRKLKQLKKKK